MMDLSWELGLASLSDADYLDNERMILIFGAMQVFVLLVTVYVSVFKPWKSFRKAS